MGNRIDTRVVLGSLRYKSAPDTNLFFQVPLIQNTKEITEFDRSIDVGLEQVYDNERQNSDIFRPIGKFAMLFNNSYSGQTNYPPFENNLYYLNSDVAANAQCLNGATAVSWTGLPQYNEFDFIRNDFNVPGYTQPPNNHLTFIPKSASSYNWNFYASYAFENDFTKEMYYLDKKTNITLNWIAGDGIPFIIEQSNPNGLGIISFRCPVKHGLSIGEYVKLSFSYNGTDIFIVDSLGTEVAGSDEYTFNIINVGYVGSTFNVNTTGTFKRVILAANESDTTSKYYVRRHKILTNPEEAVMVKAGFEENIFGISKKYESSGFTPNQTARVSIKEGAQSYTLSFSRDILINPLLDNQQRPISELFFTVIWRGYFGWTFGLQNGSGGYEGLKQGWEFNLTPNPITNQPTVWWSNTNSNADVGIPMSTYTTSQGAGLGPGGTSLVFTYVDSLVIDDTLDGDYCEWNDYEQKERVISEIYHKFTFNPFAFNIGSSNNANQKGYYYKPHHLVTTRVYSDYIEDGDIKNVVGIPNYSYFSTTKNLFVWRDLYPYGFIDTNGLGVNYPFLNGAHYPYGDYIFRIISEGTNYNDNNIIAEPTIDPCE